MARRKRRERLASVEAPKNEARRELEFSQAAEVEDIARELITDHHQHLINARIEYVYRSKATRTNGKVKLGTARKVGGLTAFLAGQKGLSTEAPGDPFFVIEIAADYWKALNAEQQRALVDHELSHCWVNEDTGKLQILPHDVEEFAAVIQRHGLWSEDVRRFTKVTQMALPFSGRD